MPSPEGEPRSGHDQSPRREDEPIPYYRAARFVEENLAARVYAEVQDTIHGTPCDLSAYRLLIDRVPHVTVVGAPPPDALDQRLTAALAAGEAADLPANVVAMLLERRRQANHLGPWVEGHYRPGQPL
jgi:hypothetical protein